MNHYRVTAQALKTMQPFQVYVNHDWSLSEHKYVFYTLWRDWGGDSLYFWVQAVDDSGNVSDKSQIQLAWLDTLKVAPPDTTAPSPPGGVRFPIEIVAAGIGFLGFLALLYFLYKMVKQNDRLA